MNSERFASKNSSNHEHFYLQTSVDFYELNDGIIVVYDKGSQRSAKFALAVSEGAHPKKSSKDLVPFRTFILRTALLFSYEAIRQHYVSPKKALEPLYRVQNSTIMLVLVGYFVFLGIPNFVSLSETNVVSFFFGMLALVFLVCAAIALQLPIGEGLRANVVERTCAQISSDFTLLQREYVIVAAMSFAALATEIIALFTSPSSFPSAFITNTTSVVLSNTTTMGISDNALNSSNISLPDLISQVVVSDSDTITFENPLTTAPNIVFGLIVGIGASSILCFSVFYCVLLCRARNQRVKWENQAKEWNLKLLPVEDYFDISDFTILDYIEKCKMLKDVATLVPDNPTETMYTPQKETHVAQIVVEYISELPQINTSYFGCRISIEIDGIVVRNEDLKPFLRREDVFKSFKNGKGFYFIGSIFALEQQINFKEFLRNARETYPEDVHELNEIIEQMTPKGHNVVCDIKFCMPFANRKRKNDGMLGSDSSAIFENDAAAPAPISDGKASGPTDELNV